MSFFVLFYLHLKEILLKRMIVLNIHRYKQLIKLQLQILNIKLNMEPDLIKKAKINYLLCKAGGIHEGQRMSFICVDAKCQSKGLICPVCKEMQHSDHEVLHLKVFFDKLYNQYPKEDDFKFSSVSDQLNKLENCKKTMISTLKENVKALADMVKKVQEKIQENYIILRRIILSQSTVSSKIPNLYRVLTSAEEVNEEEIKAQIRRCSQLLQAQNNKVQIVNGASKLLNEYTKNSDTFIAHFTNIIADLPKKFNDLPLKVKKIGLEEEASENKNEHKFSQNLKAGQINVSDDQKTISIPNEMGVGGLAFIDSSSTANIRKINFKVNKSISESIGIGIGNPEVFKDKNFLIEMETEGLFGICSMGIILGDFDSPSFVFSEGDIIQVVYNVQEVSLTFTRRNGIEKQIIHPPIAPFEAGKMSFFCGLPIAGDEVSIVD